MLTIYLNKDLTHTQKPIRKRKHHDIELEESDESDFYVTEICRRPKNRKKKKEVIMKMS